MATSANLANPSGVAFDAATGDLYISDAGHFRVRRVRGGVITTVAGTGTANRVSDWVEPGQVGGDPTRQPLTPAGLAIVGQSLWVAADARLYALDLSAALPTITVALPTATSTATAPLPTSTATARPTLVPTSTHTSVPTATATIRACDVGEAPSCVMSRIF